MKYNSGVRVTLKSHSSDKHEFNARTIGPFKNDNLPWGAIVQHELISALIFGLNSCLPSTMAFSELNEKGCIFSLETDPEDGSINFGASLEKVIAEYGVDNVFKEIHILEETLFRKVEAAKEKIGAETKKILIISDELI